MELSIDKRIVSSSVAELIERLDINTEELLKNQKKLSKEMKKKPKNFSKINNIRIQIRYLEDLIDNINEQIRRKI